MSIRKTSRKPKEKMVHAAMMRVKRNQHVPVAVLQRRALERQATRLLAADRRRQRRALMPKKRSAGAAAELPRRLTLGDLSALRRRGLVP
jgi:hypothetical protein